MARRGGPSVESVLEEWGRPASARELRAAGVGWRALEEPPLGPAVERTPSGLLYVPGMPWASVVAREMRGAPACVTAAEAMGLSIWRPGASVHVATRMARPRRPWPEAPPVVLHLLARLDDVLPVGQVLGQVMRCLPELEALVTVESAVNRGLFTMDDARQRVLGPGSSSARRILDRVDPGAQPPAGQRGEPRPEAPAQDPGAVGAPETAAGRRGGRRVVRRLTRAAAARAMASGLRRRAYLARPRRSWIRPTPSARSASPSA
ncbi:hypothetical protein ACQ7DA_05010 [Zafaria sp. J156]|uniref:hypothetical protein n=1 Tax=Zafaria sp. J156 TaxID=3116490 RepID=UPI002E791398|nr:hypothetical protein [Zafaria sp. J156]MEE1620586.1 hypothetical protein [Zafaria sp. J156]